MFVSKIVDYTFFRKVRGSTPSSLKVRDNIYPSLINILSVASGFFIQDKTPTVPLQQKPFSTHS